MVFDKKRKHMVLADMLLDCDYVNRERQHKSYMDGTYRDTEQLMSNDDIISVLLDLQQVSNMHGLGVNCIVLYQDLYHEHRSKNGTYKYMTEDYPKYMNSRYDECFCWINHLLEDMIEERSDRYEPGTVYH